MKRTGTRRLLAAIAPLACLVACAGNEPAGPAASAPPTPPPGSILNSPVRGGQNGVEVRFWPVIDETLIEAELERLAANPVPIDGAARARWAACGLRVLAVPLSEVDRLATLLAMAPASRLQGADPHASVSRFWIPQGPNWMECVRGPMADGPRTVALHDSRLAIGPDPLRLLVRCYGVPIMPETGSAGLPRAGIRFEIVPQVLDAPARTSLDPLGPQTRRTEEHRGLMLVRLEVAGTLATDVALLVTTDAPAAPARFTAESPRAAGPANPNGVGAVERRGDPAQPGEAGKTAAGAPEARGPSALGPESDSVPTLGQAMLVYPGPGARSTRAVVLLIPRAPDHFSLLGR